MSEANTSAANDTMQAQAETPAPESPPLDAPPDDLRSDEQRAVDTALSGSAEPTAYDNGIARIVKEVNRLYEGRTKHYLAAGNAARELIISETERRGADKTDRAELVKQITESVVKHTDLPIGAIRINDWMACAAVARLYYSTRESDTAPRSFAKPDPEFYQRVSYPFLATVKAMVERTKGEDWEFVKGAEGALRELVRDRLNGVTMPETALRKRVADHLAELDRVRRESAGAKMTPEQVQRAEERRQVAEIRKREAATLRALDALADKVDDLGISASRLGELLVTQKIIPPPALPTPDELAQSATVESARATVDALVKAGKLPPAPSATSLEGFANVLTADDAKRLVELLSERGAFDVVIALLSASKRTMQALKAHADAEAA